MALGASEYVVDALLNALYNNTAFPTITAVYVQLHDGEPGADGTANQMTETDRLAASFAAPAAPSGTTVSIANDAVVEWDPIESSGAEDATHFSVWDALTTGTGNFLNSGAVTANAFTDGDVYGFAIGALVMSHSVATT